MESGQMGAWASVDHAFPGYREALSEITEFTELFGSLTQRPQEDPRSVIYRDLFNYHLGAMSASADHITATVCTLERFRTPEVSTPPPPSYSPSPNFPSATQPYTFTVELQRPEGSGADQPAGLPDRSADEHDPRGGKVPSWNVFGDWKIRVLKTDRLGVYDQPECLAGWRQLFPGWIMPPGDPLAFHPPQPTSDFDTAVAFRTVPPNFPEWIARTGDAA